MTISSSKGSVTATATAKVTRRDGTELTVEAVEAEEFHPYMCGGCSAFWIAAAIPNFCPGCGTPVAQHEEN